MEEQVEIIMVKLEVQEVEQVRWRYPHPVPSYKIIGCAREGRAAGGRHRARAVKLHDAWFLVGVVVLLVGVCVWAGLCAIWAGWLRVQEGGRGARRGGTRAADAAAGLCRILMKTHYSERRAPRLASRTQKYYLDAPVQLATNAPHMKRMSACSVASLPALGGTKSLTLKKAAKKSSRLVSSAARRSGKMIR